VHNLDLILTLAGWLAHRELFGRQPEAAPSRM